ncbi:MAG: RHS repeat protein [Planctomycetota bacterium]|nr:MAG: RHS repeat protein [Planctomycetota bacterium]REK29683.1 MAG: RHS repeat protein [Planctomycetota bacterium]REK30496.1 MAG: RHS repeat protein [Planctomycetota bacterium]
MIRQCGRQRWRETASQDSDWTGSTTRVYDARDLVTVVANPDSKRLTYTYDAARRRETLVDPDGGTTTYSYNAAGRRTKVVNAQSETTTLAYDAAGRQTQTDFGNGTITDMTYDDAGRMTAIGSVKSGSTVINRFTYTYDDAGNRLAVVEDSGDRVTWTYDNTYQLLSEDRSGSSGYAHTFTYDPVGNRLTKDDGTAVTTYTYDAANRLQTAEDGSGVTTHTFDANGNERSIEKPSGDLTTYTWDYENQMSSAEDPAGDVTTYVYTAAEQRVEKETDAETVKFLWDGQNIVQEYDDLDVTQADYTNDPRPAPQPYGNLISQHRDAASSFYHYDALGSTRSLTDSSEVETDDYAYEAFGKVAAGTGSTTNPFQWVGAKGIYTQEDDRRWMRARELDAASGRFLSEDPARDDSNLYRYVGNNPTNAIDPSGLQDDRANMSPEERARLKRFQELVSQIYSREHIPVATQFFRSLSAEDQEHAINHMQQEILKLQQFNEQLQQQIELRNSGAAQLLESVEHQERAAEQRREFAQQPWYERAADRFTTAFLEMGEAGFDKFATLPRTLGLEEPEFIERNRRILRAREQREGTGPLSRFVARNAAGLIGEEFSFDMLAELGAAGAEQMLVDEIDRIDEAFASGVLGESVATDLLKRRNQMIFGLGALEYGREIANDPTQLANMDDFLATVEASLEHQQGLLEDQIEREGRQIGVGREARAELEAVNAMLANIPAARRQAQDLEGPLSAIIAGFMIIIAFGAVVRAEDDESGSSDGDIKSDSPKTTNKPKPLSEWLKDDPELLDELRTEFKNNPEWQGIDPDSTPVFYRPKAEVDAIRAKQGESGGHHPHGLALGGPEGQTLTPTNESITKKNPLHSKATALQRKVINRIRNQIGQ